MPPQQLQRNNTLDGLNVDFDSILGSLNGGGTGGEDFDVFSNMGSANSGHDANAIFVPVDSGVQGGEFGQTSPNGGLQQWVSTILPPNAPLEPGCVTNNYCYSYWR